MRAAAAVLAIAGAAAIARGIVYLESRAAAQTLDTLVDGLKAPLEPPTSPPAAVHSDPDTSGRYRYLEAVGALVSKVLDDVDAVLEQLDARGRGNR